jgi:hypothetical protein
MSYVSMEDIRELSSHFQEVEIREGLCFQMGAQRSESLSIGETETFDRGMVLLEWVNMGVNIILQSLCACGMLWR